MTILVPAVATGRAHVRFRSHLPAIASISTS